MVRPLVCLSVSPSICHTLLFWGLRFLASLLLPKWYGNLYWGPCPPTRNWGSRVFGLVFFFCGFAVFFFLSLALPTHTQLGKPWFHPCWHSNVNFYITVPTKMRFWPILSLLAKLCIFVYDMSWNTLAIVFANKFWARWIIFVGQIIDWCVIWMFHVKGYY